MTPVQEESAAALTTDTMFRDVANDTTLSDGKTVVNFKFATITQLGQLMRLFAGVLGSLTPKETEVVLRIITSHQQAAMDAGLSPYDAQVAAMLASMQDASIIFTVVGAMIDELPVFLTLFTDLKKEDAAALNIADAAVCLFGTIAANYAFFTQHALPAMKGFFAQRSFPAKEKEAAKPSKKPSAARTPAGSKTR